VSDFAKESVEAHFVAGGFALRNIVVLHLYITLSFFADIVSQVHGSTFESFSKVSMSLT